MNVRAGKRFGMLLALGLTACVPPSAEHTVEDYRADAALRQAQLDHCAKDPGTLKDTPDCVNAREAARQESTRSLRDMPPVSLPREGKPYVTPAPDAPGTPAPKD